MTNLENVGSGKCPYKNRTVLTCAFCPRFCMMRGEEKKNDSKRTNKQVT